MTEPQLKQARDADDWDSLDVTIHAFRAPLEPMRRKLFGLLCTYLRKLGFTSEVELYDGPSPDTIIDIDGWKLSLSWPSHNTWLAVRKGESVEVLDLRKFGFDARYLFVDTLQGQAAINGPLETLTELNEQLDRLGRDGWRAPDRCEQVDRNGGHWEYTEYRGYPIMRWSTNNYEAMVGAVPPGSSKPAAFLITGELWREIAATDGRICATLPEQTEQ